MFPGKIPENPEIDESTKSEPFNRKFREESQMELKFTKILVYVARFSSFPVTLVHAVPFATRDFQKCKPEFSV